MPWPTSRHNFFGKNGVWGMTYLHATDEFPLGRIGDKSTPPDKDRALIEERIGEYGPVIHVALAPHPTHNIVVALDEVPDTHVTHICDAVILPMNGKPFLVETLLGDCACVVIEGKKHLGFMHVGRAEVLDHLVYEFLAEWNKVEILESTEVYIGPVLSAQFHAISDPQPIIDKQGQQYLTPKTIWDTWGFSITAGIVDQFVEDSNELVGFEAKIEPDHIGIAEFCPFSARLAGCTEWGSDQFFKKNHPGQYSPRDCAVLHYEG